MPSNASHVRAVPPPMLVRAAHVDPKQRDAQVTSTGGGGEGGGGDGGGDGGGVALITSGWVHISSHPKACPVPIDATQPYGSAVVAKDIASEHSVQVLSVAPAGGSPSGVIQN